MGLQARVDALAYPPTHSYKIDGMVPTGDLADRVAVIEREFPDFFRGRLLDVGCNKGFFSLYHRGPVVGIDTNAECVSLCRQLAPHAQFFEGRFGDHEFSAPFDRVFVGNGPHHLFVAANGWGWIDALAKVSCGQVLLEGPVDMTGVDAQRCIPADLSSVFNRIERDLALARHFWVVREVPSPLVDRFFTLLLRKRDFASPPAQRYAEYLVHIYSKMRDHVRPTDTVLEVCTRHDRGVLGELILPHERYVMVDRDPDRPGLVLDAVADELPASDVTVSTAILHHTAPGDVERLFANLARRTRRTIILTGPNVEVIPELFGDHRYHLDQRHLAAVAQSAGWRVEVAEPCGHSLPLSPLYPAACELFMVFGR